jgi:hypothetical protein
MWGRRDNLSRHASAVYSSLTGFERFPEKNVMLRVGFVLWARWRIFRDICAARGDWA